MRDLELSNLKTNPIYLISQNEKFIYTELNEKVILEEEGNIDIKELKRNYICRIVTELPSYMQTLFYKILFGLNYKIV